MEHNIYAPAAIRVPAVAIVQVMEDTIGGLYKVIHVKMEVAEKIAVIRIDSHVLGPAIPAEMVVVQ
jgi:hypothetical protein